MDYENAIKEAFALAKSDIVVLETLELVFAPTNSRILIVSNTVDIVATLETSEIVTFKAVGMKMKLPARNQNGFQDLTISISNINLEASDFLEKTLGYDDPVICYYRPYLANDLTMPQIDPPLTLYISDADITSEIVSVRASFADFLNKPFLSEKYTRTFFPAL